VIPSHIQRVFEIADIPKVFDVLEDYFHTSKNWRKGFKEELSKASRSDDEREVFANYLMKNLDQSLMLITQRRESVILSIMQYLCKDRINEKRKEYRNHSNYYNNPKK
jgi:hypothetical protein